MINTQRVLAAILLALSATAPLPAQTPATLTVNGDLTTRVLSAEDLAKMPRETVKVAGPGGVQVEYEGVLLREILAKAGAPLGQSLRGKTLASYVLAKAGDGYQVVFTLAELDPQFGAEHILVADKRDGKALPADQGPCASSASETKRGRGRFVCSNRWNLSSCGNRAPALYCLLYMTVSSSHGDQS